MIKNVQLKRVNKILDVDYDLISSAILLFMSITVCDLGTSSRFIKGHIFDNFIYLFIYIYIYNNNNNIIIYSLLGKQKINI